MSEQTPRAEHLQWCKDRAYEKLDQGDVNEALASFLSDVGKHDGTRDIASSPMMGVAFMHTTIDGMRNFIEGWS